MAFYMYVLLSLPLFLLLISLLLKRTKNRGISNLPPSPPKLPIIGNLHKLGKLPHRSLFKLSKEYGPVMLLQLGHVPTLVISSAEAAREVMKTHDLDFCSRPSLLGFKRLSYNFLDIAFAPYGGYWRDMKKLTVLEVFSMKRVQSFGSIRAEEVANMIRSISDQSCIFLNTDSNISTCTPVINMTKELAYLTNQITCRVAFGKSYEGRAFNSGRSHQEVAGEAVAVLSGFSASDFFPYVGCSVDLFIGFHARLEECFRDLDSFFQQVIEDHLDRERMGSPDQEDIVDVLLRLQKNHITSEVNFTGHNFIKAILMNVFLGGAGTSSVTMVWALTELIKKPNVMKKAQEEIRNYVGKKGKVEEKDLNQLVYLKMVIKETLRLHPPAPLLPRESIRCSKIDGYDIEPKTRVMVNVWAIGRNPAYWENPDEFFPERFENSSLDYKGQEFEFLPFGAGRRICPGISMGVATMELALANLLYCFNWELPKDEVINMDETSGLVVHKKYSLSLVPIKYI